MSNVKDPTLAPAGEKQVKWAEEQMTSLLALRDAYLDKKPLEGKTIGLALHVTKETAVLLTVLRDLGAKIAITGCNPLSTQDDVAAYLATCENINVFAHKGESNEEYYEFLNNVLDFHPQLVIDDGCDLVNLLHTERTDQLDEIIGGCEETTTGVIRLHAMEKEGVLKFPVIAVNDNATKHLIDNYYGTGQSTLDGITRATNILWAGKTVVVVGYGDCGKGVALRARGWGSNVVVTEVDPFRALQAHYDGFTVLPMHDAAPLGDIFITVTGNKHVIRLEHVKRMKQGAILANSGHFDIEIDVVSIKKAASKVEEVRPFLEKLTVKDKHVYICAEGRLVNLSAAEGHPSTVMATSFMGQTMALLYLLEHDALEAKVYSLPAELDEHISSLQLDSLGIGIDTLTDEQIEYLSSWQEGT